MAAGEPPPPPYPHEVVENTSALLRPSSQTSAPNHPLPPPLSSDGAAQPLHEAHACSSTFIGAMKINLQPKKSHQPPKATYANILKASSSSMNQSRSFEEHYHCAAPILKPITTHDGKPAITFSITEKRKLVDKLKYVLIAKSSHGRPLIAIIRKFFLNQQLKGNLNLSVFYSKHVYVECNHFEDYVKIWSKGVWIIHGFPLRMFKWDEGFNPIRESAVVPVWIHLPRLPLYLFEERALLSIANAIGRPLKVDSNNINRSKLGCASLCVEIDVSKDLVDEIWINVRDDSSDRVLVGFWQSVSYGSTPQFCTTCAHLGHRQSSCLRKVEVSDKQAVIGTKHQDGNGSISTSVLVHTAFSRLNQNLGTKGMSKNLDEAGMSSSKDHQQIQGMLVYQRMVLSEPKLLQNSLEPLRNSTISEQDCITVQQECIVPSKVEVRDLEVQSIPQAAVSEAHCRQGDIKVEGVSCNQFGSIKTTALEQTLICPLVEDTLVAAGEDISVEYKGESSLEEGEISEDCLAKEVCQQQLEQLAREPVELEDEADLRKLTACAGSKHTVSEGAGVNLLGNFAAPVSTSSQQQINKFGTALHVRKILGKSQKRGQYSAGMKSAHTKHDLSIKLKAVVAKDDRGTLTTVRAASGSGEPYANSATKAYANSATTAPLPAPLVIVAAESAQDSGRPATESMGEPDPDHVAAAAETMGADAADDSKPAADPVGYSHVLPEQSMFQNSAESNEHNSVGDRRQALSQSSGSQIGSTVVVQHAAAVQFQQCIEEKGSKQSDNKLAFAGNSPGNSAAELKKMLEFPGVTSAVAVTGNRLVTGSVFVQNIVAAQTTGNAGSSGAGNVDGMLANKYKADRAAYGLRGGHQTGTAPRVLSPDAIEFSPGTLATNTKAEGHTWGFMVEKEDQETKDKREQQLVRDLNAIRPIRSYSVEEDLQFNMRNQKMAQEVTAFRELYGSQLTGQGLGDIASLPAVLVEQEEQESEEFTADALTLLQERLNRLRGDNTDRNPGILSDGMGDIPRPFKIKSAPNSPKGRNSSYDSSTYLLSRGLF